MALATCWRAGVGCAFMLSMVTAVYFIWSPEQLTFREIILQIYGPLSILPSNKTPPIRPVLPHVQPACNHDLLRNFYKESERFPEDGTWVVNDTKHHAYHPTLCDFRSCDLMSFFKSNGISLIWFVGDSQGYQSLTRMTKLVADGFMPGTKCLVAEDYLHNDRFTKLFSSKGVTVRLAVFDNWHPCSECERVMNIVCTRTIDSYSVTLQYIGLFKWDAYLVNVSSDGNTYQTRYVDYIFRNYSRQAKPHVVIVYPLFNHLKARNKLMERGGFNDYVQPVVKLVDEALPITTKIIWITNPTEVEMARHDGSLKFKYMRFGKQRLLAGDVMYLFSGWLFAVLKDYLNRPLSNHLGFFNLVNMTVDRPLWCTDGVHYNDEWYKTFLTYIFQTLCHGI